MGKYTDIANEIIKDVGGKDNIMLVTHCMTRLRFDLKDENKIDEKALSVQDAVISTAHAAGKFQVIVGNQVSDIYDELIGIIGMKQEDTDASNEHVNVVTRVVNVIVKVITPTLNVMVAAGLLKGILAIVAALGWASPTSGTYAILNALGDSLFYFFPIILGYTSAETFGLNKFIGMITGAVLMYPAMVTTLTTGTPIWSIFAGTAFEAHAFADFFGLPVLFPATTYASTVIPIILINLFASKIEKLCKKYIPEIVGFAFTPLITLIISVPLGLLIIGPISNFLQSLIGWMASSLLAFSPILATIVVAMIYQPLVIFGLHWPLITLAITNFQTLGYDYLWPMMFTASFAQTAVVMAVGMRTKNPKTKSLSYSAIVSGLMCIIEPAIYGFSLKDKKRFAISMIGATIGGLFITLTNTVQYSLGIGLLGLSGFINPANGSVHNVITAAIGTIITMISTFAATWLTFKDVDVDPMQSTQVSDEDVSICAPIEGTIVPISEVNDQVMAQEVLGPSVAIEPKTGIIYAPCDATVESVFPTGHAIGLTGPHGESILIHMGIDTVNLQGKGFTKHCEQGQKVHAGDILLEVDIQSIKAAGYDITTIVTICNPDSFVNITKATKTHVDKNSEIFHAIMAK